uniref:Uncharacterized protein n=1 Tax=viral metagenome TaxID=1070528 RepID=A0A6C0F224_9ZZZZ
MGKLGKTGKNRENPRKIGKMHQKNRSCIR